MDHTPGPWTIQKEDNSIVADNPYGKDQMKIADVRGWGHLTGKGGGCAFSDTKAAYIQDANARLLAAAPELLEVVKKILEPQKGEGCCGYKYNRDDLEVIANHIIGKVEGK